MGAQQDGNYGSASYQPQGFGSSRYGSYQGFGQSSQPSYGSSGYYGFQPANPAQSQSDMAYKNSLMPTTDPVTPTTGDPAQGSQVTQPMTPANPWGGFTGSQNPNDLFAALNQRNGTPAQPTNPAQPTTPGAYLPPVDVQPNPPNPTLSGGTIGTPPGPVIGTIGTPPGPVIGTIGTPPGPVGGTIGTPPSPSSPAPTQPSLSGGLLGPTNTPSPLSNARGLFDFLNQRNKT